MSTETTSASFFDGIYRQAADPWSFASSEYELARYRTTLESLGGRRYRRAFEPGCSIGVLTEGLAGVCDAVEAMDISPTAVERARERCGGLDNVRITCGSLEDSLPEGEFDFMVLSEIGYYFEEADLRRIVMKLLDKMMPGGTLLAVHWLGESKDHVLTGDRVHEVLTEMEAGVLERAERHEGFRLDRWRLDCERRG